MKSLFFKIGLRAAVVLLGWLLCQTGWASVGFTVTPSAVSNTYNGPITLLVTGLNAGGTVLVQKYLDANANGIIDAGDILVQQFSLTDGSNCVIGGVTNINVPGDTDTVAGQITAKLNLQADFAQTIVGNFLFVMLSLGVNITNSFAVTNYPFAQKFTGTVAENGVGVPYAIVIIFQSIGGSDQNSVAATLANSSGVYTLPAPPGTYGLAAIQSNYVADQTLAANLVLNSGATIATNLSLVAATQTITGRIFDTNNSSLGLPGLLVAVTTETGLVTVAFTDTNGNFSAGVNANQWKFESGSSAQFALHNYVQLNNKTKVNTTGGSVSGVAIAVPRATALFYGAVKDNFGNPLPGIVAVRASDQNVTNNNNDTYQADGYTDANGNFATGVVGSSDTNDFWQVQIDNASSFPNYNFSQPSFDFSQNGPGGTNMAVGEVVLANFTAILATNHITGRLLFNGGPVTNVQVYASSQDTNNYQTQALTDGRGNYTLNVANNTWNVGVSCQGGDNSLDNALGSTNYQCPCGLSVTISNNSVMTNIIVPPSGGPGEIFGYLTNTVGGPISNVNVSANDCNGNTYSASTGTSGYYSINVPSGNWYVIVDCNGLNSQGYDCVSSTNVIIAGDNIQVNFSAQSMMVMNPRPGIGAPMKSGARFQFLLNGASNQIYTLQVTTNLSSSNWVSLFSTNNATSNSFLVTDPNAINKQGFYRILVGP